jgi:hypothetical protein
MATAMSFPAGRHFFVEDGVLKLTVAKTPLEHGGEGVLEHPVHFCPFCGKPVQRYAPGEGRLARLKVGGKS